MSDQPTTILVMIKRLKDLYVATSDDLRGLHVADPDLGTVIKCIPGVIRAIYKAKYDVSVLVQEYKSEEAVELLPLRYMAKAA